VTQTTDQAQQVVRELFDAYLERDAEMPDSYAGAATATGPSPTTSPA
jgi:dGTP triphosphohydrolase